MNKKYLVLLASGLIIFMMTLSFSCTHTRLLNISKSEISQLDTIYSQTFRHKFWDTEWILYEKQICHMKMKFVGTKIITGTWVEKNDTIFAYFFYGHRIASERKLLINKESGKMVELYNQ
jgi:hypothetical protein